jgi:large subunit ribosomal protein L4
MKLPVYTTDGKKTDTLEIAEEWEKMPLAKQAIKDAIVYYLANKRRGTAKVKDRSEVNFTTRKPWRQKGTGRARAGTASSPIWRKGGVVFGPKPRDFSISLPKKVRRLALKSAIGDKVRSQGVIIVGKIDIDKPKTKIAEKWLENLEGGSKPLIVVKEINKNVQLSVRNIPGVGFSRASDLNTYIVLEHRKMIVERDAWEELENRLLKSY